MSSLLAYTAAYRDPVYAGYPLGNGYRSYLPHLMRFNAPDSWAPFGRGGINPYSYCADDPVNRRDPSGHMDVEAGMSELARLSNGGDDEAIAAVRTRNTRGGAPSASPRPSTSSYPPDPEREWGHAIARSRADRLKSFGRTENDFVKDGRKMARRGKKHLFNQRVIRLKVAKLTEVTAALENSWVDMERSLVERRVLLQTGRVDRLLDDATFERALGLQSIVIKAKTLFHSVEHLRQASLLRDVSTYKKTMADLKPRLDRVDDVISQLVDQNGELDDVEISDDDSSDMEP